VSAHQKWTSAARTWQRGKRRTAYTHIVSVAAENGKISQAPIAGCRTQPRTPPAHGRQRRRDRSHAAGGGSGDAAPPPKPALQGDNLTCRRHVGSPPRGLGFFAAAG